MHATRRTLALLTALILALAGCSSAGGGGADTGAGGSGGDGLAERLGDGELPGSGGNFNGAGPSAAFGESAGAAGAAGGSADDAAPSASDPSASAGGVDGDGASLVDVPSIEQGTQVAPGTLTAGAWDDNLNFERFSAYRSELLQSLPGALPTTDAEHAAAHAKWSEPREANVTLDIALVIDTTGSMSDEITYLQTEFRALSEAIEAAYPESAQRWSLVVYRDETDAYVVRWFDFRDDADDFRDHLLEQVADGGGDFPEAPDQALEKMTALQWRTDADTARLAFWVADAPHHDANADRLAGALRAAEDLDIHLYPVASSGVDELTELTMRSSAQLTGGRYVFLTDDSGVGGAHKEPSIPCYFVTKLDDAILRMVDIEMSGQYREPTEDEILRTGGDPQDGACTLESGDAVLSF